VRKWREKENARVQRKRARDSSAALRRVVRNPHDSISDWSVPWRSEDAAKLARDWRYEEGSKTRTKRETGRKAPSPSMQSRADVAADLPARAVPSAEHAVSDDVRDAAHENCERLARQPHIAVAGRAALVRWASKPTTAVAVRVGYGRRYVGSENLPLRANRSMG
jgi:hypothetical protein